MDFFDKNLEAFRLHNSLQVKKILSNDSDLFPIQFKRTLQKSLWYAKDCIGEFGQIVSPQNNIKLSSKSLHILYGLADGQSLRAILEQPDAGEILVFEPSLTLIRDVFTQIDICDLLTHERVRFIIGVNIQLYIREIEHYGD